MLRNPEPKRIVCFRTDRIGDLVLAMPAMSALASARPDAELHAVVANRTAELIERQPWVRGVIRWDTSGSVAELTRRLRAGSFDAAVVFYPHYKIAFALIAAGIPVRIGTAYRWYSPLFSRRVRVRRAANVMHEADCNARLLDPFELPAGFNLPIVAPVISVEAREVAERLLLERELNAPYVVVHPGSGGSALNAPPRLYGAIARQIEGEGYRVALTGTRAEMGRLNEVRTVAGLSAGRVLLPENLAVLTAVLSGASAFVGPSTGPMHIAAAMGVPTIALFPPVLAQSPVRWGPRGTRTVVIMAQASGIDQSCGGCGKRACPKSNCMDAIEPARVIEAFRRLIATN